MKILKKIYVIAIGVLMIVSCSSEEGGPVRNELDLSEDIVGEEFVENELLEKEIEEPNQLSKDEIELNNIRLNDSLTVEFENLEKMEMT